MSTQLGPLYHWSPLERRASIAGDGLVPGSAASTSSRRVSDICLSTDAAEAWGLSGETAPAGSSWDLWQVELAPEDDVHVQPQWGPGMSEVRVRTAIPHHRVVWVASRRVAGWETAWHGVSASAGTSPTGVPR